MAPLVWPLDRGFTVTSPFGSRWGTTHWGTDFGRDGGSGGNPVYAVQGGTVVQAGAASGFGQWVLIDHPAEDGGGTTVYGHVIPEVSAGQRVEAGQRIARIHPTKGPGNGGVDPHLHLEWHRYVWSPVRADGTAPDRLDPMTILHPGRALYVDELHGTPTTPNPGGNVALFGVDISNWQKGLDIGRVKAEGFRGVIAKVSEGAGFRDPQWIGFRDAARAVGLPVMGYHYLQGDDVGAQAETFVRHLGDTSIPVMVDVEVGTPNIGHVRAFIDAVTARGVRVALLYLPRWFWSGHLGCPDLRGLPPLMSSDYGNERTGFASAIYPGDDNRGWEGYGGNHVAVFQFTQKALVAGQLIDAWAVKSQADLDYLFGGRVAPEGPGPSVPDPDRDAFPYGPGPAPTGDRTADIVIDWLFHYLAPMVADVKDIRAQLVGSENIVYRDGVVDLEKSYPGLEMLGGRTVADVLGAVAERGGVPRARDPKP